MALCALAAPPGRHECQTHDGVAVSHGQFGAVAPCRLPHLPQRPPANAAVTLNIAPDCELRQDERTMRQARGFEPGTHEKKRPRQRAGGANVRPEAPWGWGNRTGWRPEMQTAVSYPFPTFGKTLSGCGDRRPEPGSDHDPGADQGVFGHESIALAGYPSVLWDVS